jgi:hypothetical protein
MWARIEEHIFGVTLLPKSVDFFSSNVGHPGPLLLVLSHDEVVLNPSYPIQVCVLYPNRVTDTFEIGKWFLFSFFSFLFLSLGIVGGKSIISLENLELRENHELNPDLPQG